MMTEVERLIVRRPEVCCDLDAMAAIGDTSWGNQTLVKPSRGSTASEGAAVGKMINLDQ